MTDVSTTVDRQFTFIFILPHHKCIHNSRIYHLFGFFSAGVGRAGTFCVIYSAIRELNGTGNIGKDRAMRNNSFLLSVDTVQTISNFIRGIVNY